MSSSRRGVVGWVDARDGGRIPITGFANRKFA